MIVTAASFFGFAWGFAAFSVSKRRCRLFTPDFPDGLIAMA